MRTTRAIERLGVLGGFYVREMDGGTYAVRQVRSFLRLMVDVHRICTVFSCLIGG